MNYLKTGLAVCLCAFATFANAQNITIPDANFKAALLSHNPVIDTNSDGEISQAEAAAVANLNVNNKSISSLQGIEFFTNLSDLQCQFNQLSILNLSNNINLQILDCGYNQLSTLDFSNNVNLQSLICRNNQLTSLNVSNNINLTTRIWCEFNQLSTLDVSNNINLKYLSCGNNQFPTLDISNNTNLEILDCSYNPFTTTLDLSNNANLLTLGCRGSQLTTLDVSNNINLQNLSCSDNQLTTLDVSNNTNLKWLDFQNNQIEMLDVSNNVNLQQLWCRNNQLSTLDVSNNADLQMLQCGINQLASLFIKNEVNKNFIITTTSINIGYNFTGNPNLTFICVDENQVQDVQDYITENNIGNNPEVSSDCTIMATQEISKDKVSVYPNPVKNVLYIQSSKFNIQGSRIYDISGKLVKTFRGNSTDVSALQKGVYVLEIGGQTMKFIKE
ncbi:MAG: T9SS type A sorting domain-containing protein [Flavobacteriaceae bacterium]|nr:T9SS type A sorting domain-containing protein [Flavobacteriaceae bacterium]